VKGSIIQLSMYFILVHITKCELHLEMACVMLEERKNSATQHVEFF